MRMIPAVFKSQESLKLMGFRGILKLKAIRIDPVIRKIIALKGLAARIEIMATEKTGIDRNKAMDRTDGFVFNTNKRTIKK